MPAPAPFTFDLDLAPTARARSGPSAALEEARMAGRAEGRAEGVAEGERSAVAASARALADAAEALAERALRLLAEMDSARIEARQQAAGLALCIARKLAGHLLSREPAGEMEALIGECLSSLEGVPHLVIRCHPDLAGRLRESTEARIAETGFAGRLIVIAEPELGRGDGRIEWADGGLVRDMGALADEVEERIAHYFAGRRADLERGARDES